MNEKITKNTPAIFERYQVQTQRSADIEDGNTEIDKLQGKIWTSELSSDDGYSVDYSAPISNISPIKIGYESETFYNYTIDLTYNASLQASGTNPGFFGSNLLKTGDNFIIGGQGHDWVKGFINTVNITAYSDTDILQGYKIILSSVGNQNWNGGLVRISLNGINVGSTYAGPSEFVIPAYIGQGTLIRVWRSAAGSNPADLRFKVEDFFGNTVIGTTVPVVGTSTTGGTTAITTLPDDYVYNYKLSTTIVDGEPLKVKPGTSIFYWNRQIADNPESLENKSPDSISVSYNPTSHETKLFWKDYNQTAKRHIVKIRDTSNTDTLQLKYLPTFGNLINFNGKLEPIIDANTGDVSTIKIVDPGFDFTHPRRIEFIGDGRGAIFLATPYTFNGSLPIHDYEVVGVSTGTGDILVKSKQTYPIWGWPLPLQDTYIEGLPTIVFDKYKVSSVTQVNDNLFVVSLDYPENSGVSVSIPLSWTATVVNSTIKIHNGIQRVNLSGLPIVTESNNNKVQLQGNQFLSNWFIGCNVSSPNLPANTYITNITNSYIEFNNKGTTGGSSFLDISGNGVGYTSKTRAKVQEVSANPNLHIDPVWEQSEINDFLYREEQAVSVASIFDELQKNISQWSEEVYTKSI